MAGTLFVVSTPIGNLEDITLRALRVLREVGVIAAEDTRHTRKLLQHHGIATPTVSLHEHNERVRTPELLARLAAGDHVALVSDAGTPMVSDPGFYLVRAAVEAGYRVEAVPGASALTAALAVAGIPIGVFTFLGFPPARAGERRRWLAGLAGEGRTLVMFEAPHRIRALLTDIAEVLGNRQVVVARELTKLHETVTRGFAGEMASGPIEERGEFVVLVYDQIRPSAEADVRPSDDSIRGEFCRLTESGDTSRRSAISQIAKRHHLHARDVYSALERTKRNGSFDP